MLAIMASMASPVPAAESPAANEQRISALRAEQARLQQELESLRVANHSSRERLTQMQQRIERMLQESSTLDQRLKPDSP